MSASCNVLNLITGAGGRVEIFLADQRVFVTVGFGDKSGEKIMTTCGQTEETTRRFDAPLPRVERTDKRAKLIPRQVDRMVRPSVGALESCQGDSTFPCM